MAGSFFLHKKRTVNKTAKLIPKDEDKLECIPDVITVRNMSIYDVDSIHEYSLKFFTNEQKRLPELLKKLDYENSILGHHQTYVERCQTLENIKHINAEIEQIRSSKNKSNYLAEITPLIDEFKRISANVDRNTFGETDIQDDSETTTRYILSIISVAQKYTKLCFNIELPSKCRCIECNFDFTDVIPESDGIIRCPECRVENEANRCPGKCTSISKTVSSHGDYSERENFHKFIKRLQGKHSLSIGTNIKDKLDRHFIKEKIPVGSVIKQMPHDKKGFKAGTSLGIMLKALKSCELPEYYDDVYLICQEYWGWELADLSSDEDEIMYIYDITQVAYSKIEDKTRSSSISIPFRAFKILELLEYPYEVTDFKIPKDEKSREETDKYWKICCQTCGDERVRYIPTRKY